MTKQHISVVTLNILNDLRRWDERKDMIVSELRRMQPDLIALQEVKLPMNNGEWIAAQLGGYSVHLTPKHGQKHSKEEALAILSRLPVDHFHSTSLGGQNRVAQFVQVQIEGKRVLFVNGHFFWYPGEHSQRSQQIRVLHTWLKKHAEVEPAGVVVCGDFNGTPETQAIQVMQAPLGWTQFQSAYVRKHGREPDWTCPTPLQWRHEPWRETVFKVAGLAIQKRRGPWRGTLDYIFVNDHVAVEECHVVFNQHAPHDPTLYPSDHLGLHATLRIH
jgi:endonuclease/exonuclease/phosphatase family metal-dependent hydrolase